MLVGGTLDPNKESMIKKAEDLIRELGIREPSKAERYEKCETAARLAPQEVVDLVEDPEVREGVTWLKEVHKKGFPSLVKWKESFARTIQSLFEELGGVNQVKSWHELEGVCDKISEEELKGVDKNLREAIGWVKHIHDRSPKRRIEVIKKIDEQTSNY